MKILLLRHGLAIEAAEAGGVDASRTLSEAGREQTILAAGAFPRLGIDPSRILTSPLPRAAETARLTADALGWETKIVEEPSLAPGASPEAFCAAIREAAGGRRSPDSVLIVGHNPDLEEFVSWLVVSEGQLRLKLGKGSLAVVDLPGGLRGLSHRGLGTLRALYPTKRLVRLVATER